MNSMDTHAEDVRKSLSRSIGVGRAGREGRKLVVGAGDERVDLVNDGLHVRGGGVVSRKSSCEQTTPSAEVHGARKSRTLTELGRDGSDGRGERVEDVDGGRA